MLIIVENANTLFRNNTLPCKALTAYLALYGQSYLKLVLGPTISNVIVSDEDNEVDPVRIKSSDAERIAKQNMVCSIIVHSHSIG